jgi:hypothetical protein
MMDAGVFLYGVNFRATSPSIWLTPKSESIFRLSDSHRGNLLFGYLAGRGKDEAHAR